MAQSNGIGRVGFVFIGITALCLIIAIALQAATLHRQYRGNSDNDGPITAASTGTSEEDDLRSSFPGMFLNVTEIEARVTAWRNLSGYDVVDIGPVRPSDCTVGSCDMTLSEYNTCCCKVKAFFTMPATAFDTMGENRRLSQFNDASQYFYTESCTQTASNCEGCVCTETPLLFTAVYNVESFPRKKYAIGFFQIGNTCKDLNR